MVHCNKKTRRSSGFTMVELMVVLAIMAILAALVGGGLIAYTRLARFEKNEANARTLFQTAQIALTRRDTAGELDDFRQKVLLNGQAGAHFDPAALTLTGEENEETRKQKADELNKNIYALYYDKVTDDDSDNELLRELLGDYIYDDSLLNAAICVEIDAASGQVYSVFYDTNADKLRFGKTNGATDIYDRSYDHRRHDSLVGYYSAEDRVNVVELQQTKLKVKNPRLSNTETLTLSWGGDVTRDTQVQYVATGYSEDGTKKLFEIEVELPAVKTNEPVPLKTTIYSYNGGNKTEKEKTLYYPLSYNKGNFVLTLDAMASADLLRSCENDSGEMANSISVTDSSLYSITRLMSGGPQDFYVTLQAKARDGYSGSYTPSTPADTNVENSLFAKAATATKGNLTYFRHLYNLRWADNWASGQTADYTLAAQSLGATGLNWTGGSVTVYCPAQGKNFPPEAKVPSAEEAVAWPTILTLPKNVTLDGKNITIMNLQLRGSSVSRTGRQKNENLLDRYIGLVGENNGTIQNMTLRDADVQVNVEIVTRAKGTLPLTGTAALQPLETTDSAYRDIRAVGALCGVNTGMLENCTLTHGKNNAVSAQVLAMLPFDDTATAPARTNATVNDTTYYANEPRGIGGLVGVAMPKNGQTQKISALTVDTNVTVAGLLQDKSLKDADETLTEQARYAAAASGENSIWRSIGVGGVVGTMDAANLTLETDPNKNNMTNKAAVIGSAFTGGVVGNLYNSSSVDVTLTGLQNEGTVSVGANYLGSAEGQNSRVLGQFFGGIAGYCKDVTLRGSTSTTRRDMTETQLKTAVKGGYANDGALTDDSPLKGDFVGGLVGFASGCKLDNCTTQKGYVLGRCFVGGMAGGFSGSQFKITGGSNSSTVLGNRYVGGVVSVNGSQSTVSGVTNSGLVAGLGKNAAYVGGIAGLNDAEWGSIDAAAQNPAATIQNCVSSMASDTATNSSRSALLQALSTYKKANNQETTTRADYVGGLVGRNGKNAVLTWDKNATTVQIGAVICGNDFVGGLVGCNDATAKITNTSTSLLTVSGEIVGGKAVGGMIGLNLAPALPAADIKVTEISGTLCVGGVIGANMPVVGTDGTVFAIKETTTSGSTAGRFTTTAKAGRIKADGLAGGIIGYNCLLASAPDDLTTILPTVVQDTGLVTVNTLPRSDKEMTLNGAANQFNLEVNAYAGGIVGYNDAATRLTIHNATNGSDSNAASVGSLKMRGETGTLGSGVSLQDYNNSFNYNAYVSGKDARGYMAGGIIGCVTQNTTLDNCTNYGIVSHKSAAGGIAGWNDGSINGCSTYATLGTQQDGYAYLGGIIGINNGTVTDSAPAASITVRGRYIIGGVAGLNLTGASISYNTSDSIPVTVQANECAGGVAGVNCGNIALGGTTLKVNITAESYAGGIAGSNNKRNDKAASIAGGNVTGTVTATKNYAGGAAGANYANISDVSLTGGACVRANDQFAGGIAGSNRAGTNGQIGTITRCTNNAGQTGNNYTVYATNGNAGGIAGSNESGAQIINAGVDNGVKIGVAKCDAAGIAANNFGTIQGGSVGSCDITFAGESIGAVTAINNNEGATISGVTLDKNAAIVYRGPATNVGGIAGKNAGTIGGCKVENPALNLSSLTARADSISLGGAAGVNMQGATISGTNVTLNITDDLNKYKNLGGVAGENADNGTLLKCTYRGALGQADTAANKNITTGAANVLDTVGGIVGLNNGEVNGCSVPKITLQVMGASGLSDSQTYAEKLKSASSVGGIAGRNNSTITSCYVATEEGGGSIITARYGFVGGVAGANNGSISSSGAKGVTNLVKQVGEWFTDGSTNDMISALKGTAYDSLKGVDTVSKNNYNNVYTATGLSQNDLLVGLRGTTTTNGKSSGYLGGVAGFNTVNGTITGAATGKWFVYGDNTTDESKIGGMIGMNEATGEVKLLVNCAAVRRFTRTNSKNDNDTTYRNNRNIAYVGGVIGVQQNTTNDKWGISECVNLGTVFDSGSNYIGGIIASWLKNGGTIEKSFNFGSLSTNTNYGGGSGTVGGIVGFFDQPTPGGTANILSCQNHGDILCSGNWEGDKKHGANDVAGILGKVVMADGTNDYLRINIVDCVNGDVTMQCESLAAGIMGWLGPFGDGGTKIPNKVEVYIDRCRSYATDVTISLKSGDINLFAGICGNRGNGSATSASTTVTNCFALYKNTVSSNNAPIAMNRGSENIVAYGNYFMDENSFDKQKIAALLLLKEYVASGTAVSQGVYWGAACGGHYNKGTRLYAGIDNSIESGNRFFAAGMMTNERNLNTVDTTKCYIIPAANEKLATIFYTGNTGASDINDKDLATILLWYSDKDEISGPSMKDITDDLIQNYYTQVLDKRGPGRVSNVNVRHENVDNAVYGRYEVTWSAAVTDGIFPDNQIQNVSHYLVTLYKVDGDSKTALDGYKDIKVYGTRYLFDADDALAKAIGTGQFCVGVKAVNGTTPGAEEMSAAQYFVRPLPTPKLEIRLKKQPSNGQPYGQYLVLTNASDYKADAGNWQVTAYLMNQPNTKITLDASNTEAPIANGLGSATRLRATATPGTDATGAWMESARYDEEIGIPRTYYTTGDSNSNSGLVHGTAFSTGTTMGQPVITGSTADNLSITVNLQFTADTIFSTVPNYRVMLVGQYTGNEQISNAAEGTAANAQPLKGQYVTLAALEKPVYSSGTEFVLSNLPAVVFDGSYTDLKVISVPIDAGYPQVVTRWEITADEALKAIEKGNNSPVSWNNGIEIVRGADGKFSYYHLTPLQFFADNDPWYSISGFVTKQIRTDNLNLTLLKAPTVSDIAKGDVDTASNKLNYTFTWTQYNADGTTPDTTEHDYDVTLYGLLTQKTGETTAIAGKEKIELKDGVSLAGKTEFNAETGTYTLTLCVDDDLASGSWRYDKVRLHVTRKPGDGDTNAIGLAGEADCTVQQRLSAVGQVNSIMRTNDNSANALNYDITWPASADDKGENTVTYTLYAEKLDSNNWTALADWKGITKNSCTVDLEKYQGVTLRFYVVANAVDGKKYCSPNGEYSNPLLVETRLAAPEVTTAALSYQTPSQTQFLTEEKLTLTVQDASGGSYYYMGYLFKKSEDYTKIAKLASDWQAATNGTDDKAQKLAALTDALKAMLTDTTNPGRVLRLLPEGRMDGGAQAETTTGGAAFALGDESFTMKPEYAGYWLLPALRSMSTDGTTASSNWYYYVADGLSETPTQMQLPKIKLDAPQTNQNAFTTVDSKATLQLFGADGETAWTPASTEADISRFAVEWNAVNYSKETGEGLADKYQLEIASADGKTTDKITFTVAKRNVMNEDGTIATKCGEILSVTKAVTIKDTAYTITILPTEDNGRTFYDLTTTVETDEKGAAVLDENKNPVLTTNHVTLEGHYELKDASGTPRYKLETFATLEYLDRDGEPGYRVTLPDLVDLLHKDDTRQRITDKVTVLAEGDAEKTTQSEKLELTVPNGGTAAALTLTAEEQPAQDAAAEQSPAAAPPVLRAARVLRATPETAAAEKEELPAVG